MVYLHLSVISIKATIQFYCEYLGLFDSMADRLICKNDIDLIIDLELTGEDRHKQLFSTDNHVVTAFWISPKDKYLDDENYKIKIIDRLKKYNIEYEKVANLGGHFLKFKDPSGNNFTLHADHGTII